MIKHLRFLASLLLLAVASVAWGDTTDEITAIDLAATSTTYTDFSNVAKSSGAVYAGNSAKDSSGNIQMRSKNSNSGMVSTTSGGKVKSVTITVGSGTNTIDVYGSNTAYTAASDLYNSSTQGTKIGSVTATGTVTFTDDYEYVGIRSNNGAIYVSKIEIVWANGGDTPTLENSDLAVTGAPVALNFDLYNNASAQTVNFTTSSTGVVTVSESEYVTTSVSGNTITVTPVKVTPSAQTITISQAADVNYKAGSATFTVTVDNSTPDTGSSWVETSLSDLTADDVFVIVGNNYALPHSNGTSSAPGLVPVTISEGQITSDVTDEIKWNVSGNASDGYTFYQYENPEHWLYCNTTASSGSNNNIRVGVGARKVFELNTNNRLKTKDTYTTRYLSIYGTQDWRGYTSTDNAPVIKFYKLTDASATSISASDVNLAFDATSGSFNYTITNPIDGTQLTASTEASWISNVTVGTDSPVVTFTVEANTGEERSAVITLTYGELTKDVTVTQAAAPVSYTTIPALFEAATSETKDVNVTFDNWVVSGVSTNGKNVYVTDGTNGFVIFDNGGNLNNTYAVGKVLSGTAVPCKLVLYNGFAEITNINVENLMISDGGNVTVADIALANLAGVNTGAVVSYEGLTCSVNSGKYYLTDGTNTLQVYNSLYTFEALEDGAKYNITGVYQQYNNTKEILPRSADDIVKVEEPSITVASTEIEVVAAGAEGTINVTYNNITNVEAEVQFVGADGTTAATYDWIEAEVNDENNISYIVNENTSTEARTAYLKVYALDDNANDVYSDLISITQKGFTIDYATLPFEYDGNGQGELPTGLTQSGVASYGNSPSMKFDSEGDYLILKMNEAPKALYFDVKGNPGQNGWAGTFNVQTSDDGETYTDLASYTELTNDVQKVMLVNIPATVRYIKWIYAVKTSGNVALGNIIASNVAPETIDVSIGEKSTGADGAYYSSVYYSDKALKVPADVECLTYKVVDGALTVSKTYSVGDVIPANEAVVIKASANGTVTFMVAPTTNVKDTESMLLGVDEAETIDEPGYKYYKLTLNAAKEAGTAGFYFDKNVTDGSTIKAAAHKCYLRVPVDQTNGAKGFVFGEETDGIGQIENGELTIENSVVYDLSGRKLNEVSGRHGSLPLQLPKGIYIVNGKKVVVK